MKKKDIIYQMEDKNKYITVNIRLPLEINSNGSYSILNDYLDMEFTKCEKPCVKSETNQDFSKKFQEIFTEIMKSNIPLVPNIMVLKDEIKKKSSRLQNSSFKNRKGKSHGFTYKKRGSMNDMDVDVFE